MIIEYFEVKLKMKIVIDQNLILKVLVFID